MALEHSRHGFPTQAPIVNRLEALPSREQKDDADQHLWPRQWRAYAALLGSFFLMFNSWGLVNAYGTLASYYEDWLLPNHDALLFNLVGSTQSFFVLALSGIVGRLFDAGHCKELVATGAILVSLGMFLLSVVNGNAGYGEGNIGLVWLTQGLITGLGMACFFVTSSAVVATWFKRRKMVAMGIVASGASISGLIYPVMLKFLLAKVGFNNAVRCVAGTAGLTSLYAFFFARPSSTHVPRKLDWKQKSEWVDTHAFRHASYSWFVASIAFLFFGFYAVFFNLEEWALSTGVGFRDTSQGNVQATTAMPPQSGAIQTFWLLSIMNASSSLGRIGSAYIAEYFATTTIHSTATTTASILLLVLWPLASTPGAAIAFVTLFGIFSGSVIGLPPASTSYILDSTTRYSSTVRSSDREHNSPPAASRLGQWTGMMYTAAAIPSLVGPTIAGHLISQYDSYITVQVWSGACLFASAGCMWMSRLHSSRQKQHAHRQDHVEAGTSGMKGGGSSGMTTGTTTTLTDSDAEDMSNVPTSIVLADRDYDDDDSKQDL